MAFKVEDVPEDGFVLVKVCGANWTPTVIADTQAQLSRHNPKAIIVYTGDDTTKNMRVFDLQDSIAILQAARRVLPDATLEEIGLEKTNAKYADPNGPPPDYDAITRAVCGG